MNAKLQSSLLDDLRKSGFYSEMMAIRACASAKWECHGSFTYFDKDERATRECDFEAVRSWLSLRGDGESVRVVGRLLGQVKKSEKPWIVFLDRHVRAEHLDDQCEIIIQHADLPDHRSIADMLRQYSLITRNSWIGSGVHEAFKRPMDTSRWYSAFVSACKATEYAFDTAAATPNADTQFQLIKPVVILDGILVAAELSTDGEPLLVETDSAAFAFEYRNDAYKRPRYYVDVITLDAFPRYLDLVAARMSAVTDLLRNRR